MPRSADAKLVTPQSPLDQTQISPMEGIKGRKHGIQLKSSTAATYWDIPHPPQELRWFILYCTVFYQSQGRTIVS